MFPTIFFSSALVLSILIIVKVIRPMYLIARDFKREQEEKDRLDKIYENDFE